MAKVAIPAVAGVTLTRIEIEILMGMIRRAREACPYNYTTEFRHWCVACRAADSIWSRLSSAHVSLPEVT